MIEKPSRHQRYIFSYRLVRHLLFIAACSFSTPSFSEQTHWQRPNYIVDSFIEIALKNEYSKVVSPLRKWQQPIYYFIEHRTADEQLHTKITNLHLAHLSNITGLKIIPTDNADKANLTIIFSTEKQLTQELKSDFKLLDEQQILKFSRQSVCLANFATNTDNSIHKAIVIIPVDRARAHAKLLSCVVEELTQVLGLPNDSDNVFPSIFNDKSHNDYLSGLDYLLLSLLYHPQIKAGMIQKKVKPILRSIIESPKFKQQIEQANHLVNQQGIFLLLN